MMALGQIFCVIEPVDMRRGMAQATHLTHSTLPT